MGISPLRAAVFFDRDGVLNNAIVRDGKPYAPATVGDVVLDPYALGAVLDAHALSLCAIIVTNQPDVARGSATAEAVAEINDFVVLATGADAVYACLHDDADACECRKPKPGMLVAAAADFGIDLNQSFMIGDRAKDIGAGRSAGCRTILIDRGYNEATGDVPPDIVANSLKAAMYQVRSLLETRNA